MDYFLLGSSCLAIGYLIASHVLARRDELGIPESKGVLTSPEKVMQWLGGPIGASAWADIDPEETKDWYEEIPAGWQMRLYLRARSAGYVITPGAFGLKSDGRPYWVMPKPTISEIRYGSDAIS